MSQNPIHTRHGWWANHHIFGKSPGNYSGHAHPEFEIGLLSSGSAQIYHSGLHREVSAGEVVLFWGGLPHEYQPASDCEGLYWLTIPLEDWLNWGLPPELTSVLLGGQLVLLDHHYWTSKQFHELQSLLSGDELSLRIAQYECAAQLLRWSRSWQSASRSTRVKPHGLADRVMAILPECIAEPIDMGELASRFEANPRAMMTAFKRRYGITIGDYLRSLRLANAAELLLRSDLSVLEIANRCGFSSQSRFYDSFGKYYAMSPGAFRRLGRPS